MSAPATRTERLTDAARDQSHPTVRPKDAATLIIIDRAGPAPQVLLGRRHHSHKFLPGKFVFPGGRIESADRLMPVATALDARTETLLMRQVQRPSRDKARAIALAAIRETFEETGLMIGARQAPPAAAPPGLWEKFAQARVLPDLGALHFIARAITPPGRPKRFDTRFFAVEATGIAERMDGFVGPDSELVELVWVPIPDAVHLDLMVVTTVALEELQARIATGMPRDMPVPFYRMVRRHFVHTDLV